MLLCVSLFSACKGTSTSPLGLSTFAGRVALFDSTGHALNDFSGVTVQLDNTNFQTTTKTDGSWEIDNVPAGQYDVSATKTGFGTFYWFEQTATGGRYDLSTAGLARVTKVVADSIHPFFERDILEFGDYPDNQSDTNGHWLAAFVDLDSTVEPWAPHLAVSAGVDAQYISINDLRAAGAQPGQMLYVSYAWAYEDYGSYDYGHYECSFYDPRHHETRYASNGPKSKVFEVMMPQ